MTNNDPTIAEKLHHLHYLGYINDKEELLIRTALELQKHNDQITISLSFTDGVVKYSITGSKSINE